MRDLPKPPVALINGTGYAVGMITLLVEASAAQSERLAHTLSALIPAVVEGVVLDAVILNTDSSGEVEAIADATGAVCIKGRDVGAAIGAARGEWLMCLEPGARPEGDWFDEVLAAVGEAQKTPLGAARFRSSRPGGLRDLFRRPRALRCGLIIRKHQAATAKAPSLERLANGRAARRLSARLMPADP